MMLDALLGEPRSIWDRVPHPAVMMGRLIAWCDKRYNAGNTRKAKGAMVMLALGASALIFGWAISVMFGMLGEVVICAILLAQKSLADHVRAVADALRLSLGDGRRSVAMIVGRDTRQMDTSAVARGAIESAAENLSDGITAPIFWFAIGGLPGLLLYKITNTADSMIGYKTPRHLDFGWAAARFDDLLNWVPARITGAIIWAIAPRATWRQISAEAALHRSPNAGWPEAAMAHALGIALSGPRVYDGQLTDDPFVNAAGKRVLGPDDIDRALHILWQTWAAIFCAALIIGFVCLWVGC